MTALFSLPLFRKWDYLVGLLATAIFALIAVYDIGMDYYLLEVAGFITGAWSVWLVAKNNVWSWPMGIINGALFVVLFIEFKLYGDAAINSWYIIAGLYGWAFWLWGGKNRTPRPIGHVPFKELGVVLALLALVTYLLRERLIDMGGAAPFLDAITASMSFAAFWMQARRYIESWFIWILADIIYIPLYFSRGLPLTGVLYCIFMAMCFYGLRHWSRELGGGLQSFNPKWKVAL